MAEYLVKIIEWTKVKLRICRQPHPSIYFYEREIWWASLGANVGFEQDGKHEKFERPVLIIRKFGGKTLWGLPITTKEKTGIFYYQIQYEGRQYSIILSQLKLISSKRLLRKIRTLDEGDFEKIKEKLIDLIKNDPRSS